MTRTVEVGGAQPYRIAIGAGLLRDGAALAAHVRGGHAFIVTDAHVAPLYARDVADALQSARPDLQLKKGFQLMFVQGAEAPRA